MTPISIETGGKEEYLGNILEGMRKSREIHVQKESDDKIKRALKGRIQEDKVEEAKLEDKEYYKREK